MPIHKYSLCKLCGKPAINMELDATVGKDVGNYRYFRIFMLSCSTLKAGNIDLVKWIAFRTVHASVLQKIKLEDETEAASMHVQHWILFQHSFGF